MNIVEIIRKVSEDHVYWSPVFGKCKIARIVDSNYPIVLRCALGTQYLTEDGCYQNNPDTECILFPSRDNRDWAAFERELDEKAEKQPKFIPADDDSKHFIEVGDTFNGSVEMVSIPDRPMMAAVICAGLLAGGLKDSAGVLANKAVHYADIILKHTEEESNDKC